MAISIRPRRSALFLPASNPRAIDKARSLPCDTVILDLEDSVAPDAKVVAREAAVAAVRQGFGARERVIRVNALDTEWAADDLAELRAADVDAVLLPKVSSADDLRAARRMLGDEPPLWAMIETCRAIVDLAAITGAAAEAGLELLIAGSNDLAKEMRCRPGADRAPLLPLLSQLIVAARAAGLVVLDGVSNTIDDPAAVEAECAQGLVWGFDGKTLIHPSQIEPANRVFAPSKDEVTWAQTVIAAFDEPGNAGKGAIRVDGKMVELLHRDQAARTLAVAEAIAKAG